ncbi:MAG: GNAT family N-acetyltransferase [Aquabacterium sp.]
MSTHFEDLADRNLAEAIRIHHRWQPGARMLELNGVLLHQGTAPLPLPFNNCVVRTDPAVQPEQVLAQAEAFFGQASNPFAILTMSRPDVDLDAWLGAQGFTAMSHLPAMLAEAPVPVPQLDAPWQVSVLNRLEDTPGFIEVCGLAYETLGLPPMFMPSYFGAPEQLLSPEVTIAVARDGDRRISAAALVLHTGEVSGVYWVGTAPAARGHGLAAACTATVTNLALERGARAVTLQATEMGEPTYRKLGFREYGRMTRWFR